MAEEMNGRLVYPGEIRKFVLAGNSTFTLRDLRSSWTTYRVKSGKKDRDANWSTGNMDKSIYFVSQLVGPEDYKYIGYLRRVEITGEWVFFPDKKINSFEAPRLTRGFTEFWKLLEQGCRIHPRIEFWHEGQCCRCGRKLTVPESIANGVGPECEGKE